MNWLGLVAAAPEITTPGLALIERAGVVLLGTVRRDGAPRISPVEPLFADGELYLGMMPRSHKVADLRRDPRVSLHSPVADRTATEELKLHGRVREVLDEGERKAYCEGLFAKIGWSPESMDFALFALEIETAAHFSQAEGNRVVARFRAGRGVDHFTQGVEGGIEGALAEEPADESTG